MKIVALNPPYFPNFSRASRSPCVAKSSTLYYPFFLAYATGVLEGAGFDVSLVDSPAEKLDRKTTVQKIKRLQPSLVVCETSTPSIENDLEVMRELKDSGVPFVVAVGVHASARAEEVLEENPFLNAAARREYEYTVRDLALRLKNGGIDADLRGVEGLSFRDADRIVHNPDRPHIENLDELPWVSRVYRDHLRSHLGSYFYGANLHPVVTILSGRGCPYRCAYCVYPQTMTGNRYRLRSVTDLVDELEFVVREFPEVREVFLEDDTLTADRERARGIAREILDRKLKITWSANSRADTDYETMKIMARSGCRLLCVGFESASGDILDKLGKNIKTESYMKFRKDAARAGLLLHGCFMYGNEGETRETMRDTLEMAKKLNCDSSQFYPIMAYPGTRAYDDFEKKGLLAAKRYRDWLTEEGMHNFVVSTPNITGEELVDFCDRSRREYYLRPRYLLSKIVQIAANPREFKRIAWSGASLAKRLFRPSLK